MAVGEIEATNMACVGGLIPATPQQPHHTSGCTRAQGLSEVCFELGWSSREGCAGGWTFQESRIYWPAPLSARKRGPVLAQGHTRPAGSRSISLCEIGVVLATTLLAASTGTRGEPRSVPPPQELLTGTPIEQVTKR